jgi:hypothetical protein
MNNVIEVEAEDAKIPQTVPELGAHQRAKRREKQTDMPKLKLMIATPFYMQTAFARYCDSLIAIGRALDAAGVLWEKHFIMGDSYIDRVKNSIVADFLESDCTDLLMIDSDMSWQPDAVVRMLKHPQSIVGGFFPMKGAYGTFAGALLPGEDGMIPDLKTCVELWDGSCLFKAHLLPGGFLRLKRDVLERFADHYSENVYIDQLANQSKPDRVYTAFFECLRHNYVRYGEDATFCRLMREMGEDIWVDPNLSFGHTGMKTYEGNFNDTLLKPKEELDKIIAERQAFADSVKVYQVEQPAEVVNEAA